MSRILTLTDVHLRNTKPEGRIEDDWLNVCMGQLSAAFAIAKETECDAIVCSGDLGDGPNWSPKAMVKLIELIEDYGIPFVTTLGQHDVYSHCLDTWDQTSIGVLNAADIIDVVIGGNPYLINDDMVVYGFGFGEDVTTELLAGTWKSPTEHKNRFKVAAVHASVGPSAAMGWDGIEHQNIRGVDIASFGDIHCGFDAHEFKSGSVAYSTGSLVRSSRSDIGRIPQVAIVTCDAKDDTWGIEFREVPDGDDDRVFILNNAESTAGDIAESFKHMIKAALEYKDESPSKKVERIGKSFNYTEKQVNMILERMEVGDE